MRSSSQRPSLGDTSGRRHSTRAIRTSTTRPTNYYARPLGYRGSNAAAPTAEEPSDVPPGFFPAITHFTDSIAALPRDVVKHLTVLKETEGKAYAPSQAIAELTTAISLLPPPPSQHLDLHTQPYFGFNTSANVSVVDSTVAGSITGALTATASQADTIEEQSDMPRRILFRNLRNALQSMTSILDEKNHYLNSANDALAKALYRVDSSFPYISEEISEEAREGSNSHWALPHMRDARRLAGMPASERTRRDYQAANSLAAAAAAVHEGDIAATRSEARREAMLAKRSRNIHIDSDFDERPASKKSHKKPGQDSLDKRGINGTVANKRRRVAHAAPTSYPAGQEPKFTSGDADYDMRDVHNAEMPRKRQKPGGIHRKRNVGQSPSLASSPTASAFLKEYSPAPSMARTGSARQRATSSRNATQDAARGRPTSSAGDHRNVNGVGRVDLNGATSASHKMPDEERFAPADEGDTIEDETANDPTASRSMLALDQNILDREQQDRGTGEGDNATSVPMAATRSQSGRNSKPGTPLAGTFPESVTGNTTTSRSRASRNGNIGSDVPARRSHKKGGGLSAAIIAAQTAPSDIDDDDEGTPASEGHTSSSRASHRRRADSSSLARNESTNGLSVKQSSSGADNLSKHPGESTGEASIIHNSLKKRANSESKSSATGLDTNGADHASANDDKKSGAAGTANEDIDLPDDVEGDDEEAGAMDEAEEEEEDDPTTETLYCICDRPSFGAMIACDNDACAREWFHLDCVGLRQPPPSRTKWFCPECREKMHGGGSGTSGASGSAAGNSSGTGSGSNGRARASTAASSR